MQIKPKYLYIPNKYYDFLTFYFDGIFLGVEYKKHTVAAMRQLHAIV